MTQRARTARTMFFAAGAIALTAAPAAAGVTTHALNLRGGPGLGHHVIAAMPAGARVDVGPCNAGWCRVAWRGRGGWASARYLSDAAAPRRNARRERRADRADGKFPIIRSRSYDPWFRSSNWFGEAHWGRFGSAYSGPINFPSGWGSASGW